MIIIWNNIKIKSLKKLGQYEDAIKYNDKALAIDAKNTDALNSKGVELRDLGQYEEAIKYFDKALAIDKNYTRALNNKIIASLYLGQPKTP